MNDYNRELYSINLKVPIYIVTWFKLKSSLYLLEKEQIKLSATVSTTDREKYIKYRISNDDKS